MSARLRRIIPACLALVVCLVANPAAAANFFKCATGNWNAANVWSLVSTTTACTSATAPTASDNCIFDSGTPNGTHTVNVAATCLNLWMDGSNGGNGSTFVGTFAGASPITISGSSAFAAASWTNTSAITWNATSSQTVKWGGIGMNTVTLTFNGAGGIWTFQDALLSAATKLPSLVLTAGKIDDGGFPATVKSIAMSNTNTRAFSMNSTWTLNGNGTILAFGTTGPQVSAMTLTIGSSAKVVVTDTTTNTKTLSSGFTVGPDITVQSGVAGTVSISNATWGNLVFAATGTSAKWVTTTNKFKSMDFTGSNSFSDSSGNITITTGNLILGSSMPTLGYTGTFILTGTSGTQQIRSNGVSFGTVSLTQNGTGGTVQLFDALTLGANTALTITNGTFDANSQSISGGGCLFAGTGTKTITVTGITMTSSLAVAGGTCSLTVWDTSAANTTVNASGFTLRVTGAGAVVKRFYDAGNTNGTFWCDDGTGATGGCNVASASTNTMALKVSAGSETKFPASATTNITSLTSLGTSGSHAAIKSSTGGTNATFSKASGCLDAGYTDITDNTGSGGATWKSNGTLSNTTGWVAGSCASGSIVPGSTDLDYSGSGGI